MAVSGWFGPPEIRIVHGVARRYFGPGPGSAIVGGLAPIDPVLTWLDRAVAEGFLSSADRGLITVADTVEGVLARLGVTGAAVTPAPAPGPGRRRVAARSGTPADTR